MKINITIPKGCSCFQLRKKTKKYMEGSYNKLKAKNIFEGKNKNFYLFIYKRSIQIELINYEPETLYEIKNYLEFLFYNQYIGITLEGINDIQFELNNVRCFYL